MPTTSPTTNKPAIIGGILLLFILLYAVSFLGTAGILHLVGLSHINGNTFLVSRLMYWLCLMLIYLYSLRIEKQQLLIWEEKKYKFWVYLVMVIAILFILFVGIITLSKTMQSHGLNKGSTKMAELLVIFHSNYPLLLFTALTAGVVEELIFRGYLLPRLQLIFKSPAVAIIMSSLLFGLVHYGYGTIINVVGPVLIGLVFSVYYWKYRNIKVLICCHFLWDLIVLLSQVNAH